MTSGSVPAPLALVPVTVVFSGQRVDMAVPAAVPVADLLPGMAAALGRLNADTATQGFRVLLPSGRELDQAGTLAGQDVSAGALLTLQPDGDAAADARYDDLVEAIGASVDLGRTAWRRGDSVQLSAFSAAGLFALAAGLLLFGGGDPLLTATLAGVGGVLVALAAAVVARIPVTSGAVALALTVPVLLGVAGFVLLAGASPPGPPGAASVGLAQTGAALAGAGAALVLPRRQRAVIAGPLTVGTALLVLGLLVGYAGVTPQRAAAGIVAALTIVVLLAPWIGLAQVPARIDALAQRPRAAIDPVEVAAQVGSADVAVLSLRIAGALVTAALAPVVARDLPGLLLMTSIGLALLLGTRSLYGRAEVLAGVVGGMLTIVVAGATAAVAVPAALPWLAGVMALVGCFVVAWNVVGQQLRPGLNRLANSLHVIALMAVLPLTLWILGLL
jgi:type VII secretion integral membrane protein EccD